MAYCSNETAVAMDDCDTGTGSNSAELMREQERWKKEGKNIQWVCQLAFPFEKVTHLTAPKMSRENKGR